MRFVLASASPARLATLRAAGVEPEVVVSDVDESAVSANSVTELVGLLARAKARAVARALAQPAGAAQHPAEPAAASVPAERPAAADPTDPAATSVPAERPAVADHRWQPPAPVLVLGCDSLLELNGVALGKPADPAEARRRWQTMRGATGVLRTGHTLIAPHGRELSEVASTTVRFADVTDAEIDAYIASGEPMHVAGGFTIDGLGGWFVESVEGDHHNVVGLSLPLLRRMLQRLDLTLADLGYPGPR